MKEKFSQAWKKILAWMRVLRIHLGENPSRDWLLILSAFLLLSAVMVLFTLSSYRSLAVIPESEISAATTSPTSLDQKLRDRVVTYYEGRRTALQNLLKNPPTLVDPSR